MTRKEIDDAIANRLFEAKLMPLRVLDRNARLLVTTFSPIITGLVRDGKTKIAGFGTFRMEKVEARTRYHLSTKQRVQVPECELIKFIPSGGLRVHIATNRRKGRNTPVPE